jgi:pimeloyl-ACP methyl ester carboxylesterase
MIRPLLRLLRILAVVWLLVVIALGVFQRSLIFFPSRASEPAMLAEARTRRMQPWRDAGGAIIGWRSAARLATPVAANRLIVFHGNAGNALNRDYYVEAFEALDDGRTWEVYLFEYPGYGARVGELGEASFNAAAHAAFETLAVADARPIYVLGESIGGGPACALAAREPQRVVGVCLVTPFARLVDVAAHHYPFLPVRWILRDRWDNAAALAGYPGRLAVRLAAEDEIIPSAQGRQLFDGFSGPKRLWVEPGANHNGLDYTAANSFWQEASDFLLAPSSVSRPP